jgi:PTS system nitrogen regulatory IIA component
MQISDLLAPERTVRGVAATSKKRVLDEVSAMLAKVVPGLGQAAIFDSLIGRERLGSTGLGHGVAIPHGRVAGIERAVGCFLRLDQGVDFDAIDGAPVDLVFVLLVPEHYTDEHLQILSLLAEMFSDEGLLIRLRTAADGAQLHRLLVSWRPGGA